MNIESSFKVGDKIVDFGQVYRIFKIGKRDIPGRGEDTIIFFRPFFANNNSDVTCSIPLNSLDKTRIRKPLPKEEIQKLIKKLSIFESLELGIDLNEAKEILKQNDPHRTIDVIKALWVEKVDETRNLTRSRKEVLDMAMKRFVEEIAYRTNASIQTTQEILEKSLNKGAKAWIKKNFS